MIDRTKLADRAPLISDQSSHPSNQRLLCHLADSSSVLNAGCPVRMEDLRESVLWVTNAHISINFETLDIMVIASGIDMIAHCSETT